MTLPLVAGMATMPSRAPTAPRALASLLPQVDCLWLFLDRFDDVPGYARDPRIRVVRSQDVGDLRANGKLVGLVSGQQECVFFAVDDDVEYPPDYTARLGAASRRYAGAVVGVHAGLLPGNATSYAQDLRVLHRRSGQKRIVGVDLLGSDSLAFPTATLHFDVRTWPEVNMVDLSFALETRRRGIPLVMLDRPAHWLRALDENQDDSIWAGVLADDARQSELARELVAMPRPRLPRHGLRRLRYREA